MSWVIFQTTQATCFKNEITMMNKITIVLFMLVLSIRAFAFTVVCEGINESGTKVKYILGDIKGSKITAEEFVQFQGKEYMQIIKGEATLVAEGKNVLDDKIITDRSYVLPDNSKEYAEILLIYADGSSLISARPMAGGDDFIETKCQKGR